MASRAAALLTTLLLCTYGAPAWCGCDNATRLSQQLDGLLADYERDEPPAARVLVTLGLDVRHAALDHQHSTMRLLADLKMIWHDPRLKWNATEWECETAPTTAWRLWLPDLVVLNAASTVGDDSWLRARLNHAGNVSWISRLDVTVPVALALTNWPQDTQTCTFKFGSRVYNKNELVLEIGENFKHAVVFETGSWEIVSVSGRSSSWQRGADEVSVAAWTVEVARRAPAHTLAAAAVLLAGALLLAAAAALPPHQRHPLAACASFIAALWLMTALLRLPGGGSCPRVLGVMCALCVCGALAGACAALVARLARLAAPPPRLLRTALSTLSTLCKLTPSTESCMWSESGAWAAAARLADRALCAALLLALLVLLALQLL